jgi:hypothetical protein
MRQAVHVPLPRRGPLVTLFMFSEAPCSPDGTSQPW